MQGADLVWVPTVVKISQWDGQQQVNTDWQVGDTQEFEVYFRWNKVVIFSPKLSYLLMKNNEMFTDELIWGLGSAPQYSGVGVGLAGVEMQQDWPPADSGWSWGWVHEGSLHHALFFVNIYNFPLKNVESEWKLHRIKQSPLQIMYSVLLTYKYYNDSICKYICLFM